MIIEETIRVEISLEEEARDRNREFNREQYAKHYDDLETEDKSCYGGPKYELDQHMREQIETSAPGTKWIDFMEPKVFNKRITISKRLYYRGFYVHVY